MAFPYVAVFVVLLIAYMVYSEWTRLESRYLVAAALVLLAVTAVEDAAGAVSLANLLAEFVFLLLAGGVLLLLVDHVRDARPGAPSVAPAPPKGEPTEPTEPR